MKSIFTKVIPATNTKPTRVKAFDSEKKFSVIVTGNSTEDHLNAVKKLKDKLKWSGKMVCGDAGTVVNGMVCVFEDNETKVNPIKKRSRKIKRSTKKIVVGVSNGKKNPISTNKLYNVYRLSSGFQKEAGYMFQHLLNEGFKPEWDFVKGTSLIYLDKKSANSLVKLAELNPRIWGNASTIKKNMRKTINVNPKIKTKKVKRKIKKNPKETIYFIHGKSKKGMGLNNGLYNQDRNSLTTEIPEATHFHSKESANIIKRNLQLQFKNWIWTVKPITFFENK